MRLRFGAALAWVLLTFAAETGTEYRSPYCGPGGGSSAWACGAWPSTAPPRLGRPGSVTTDADSGNRVLRATGPGSFGEDPRTAFKSFDAGWRRAWNADSTRFIVVPWSGGPVRHSVYWLGFDPSHMELDGRKGSFPDEIAGIEWDAADPDLAVGLEDGVAVSYNVRTGKRSKIFDPAVTRWRAQAWAASWSASRVCIADGPQDKGYRIACARRDGSAPILIDLRAQTIGGKPFEPALRGATVSLPAGIGIHTIMLGEDGDWLAIDTHGNAMCGVAGLGNYASTALFLNLETRTGYEWNIACGGTHWAYGYDGVMIQSSTPKWTPKGADSPCNSDSRGLGRRSTGAEVDTSYTNLAPCSFFVPGAWDVNVHLSWINNLPGPRANEYPVLVATISSKPGGGFLANEIAAMETTAPPYRGRLWRFAQTWNDPTRSQCSFLEYASPSVSPDGRWAIFPSNWRGQTGPGGVCTGGNRTDVFVFELR